jgi:hypothetical protein
MSSLTKTDFREELKEISPAVAGLENTVIEKMIDRALRAYSRRLPEIRTDANQAIVEGQSLYNYPAGALSIVKVIDSASRKERLFATENQTGTEQFRLGGIMARSTDKRTADDFYVDPLQPGSQALTTTQGGGTFDIEYVQLHTMSTIKDTGLDALSLHVESQALGHKASEPEKYADHSYTLPGGLSSQLRLQDAAKRFETQAAQKLKAFEGAVQSGYGTRG